MSAADVISLNSKRRMDFGPVDEVNHRVANHLALLAGLIQTQATALTKGPVLFAREDVRGMLQEVVGKVIGVSQLHRRLATMPGDETIDLGDHLIESSHALVKSLVPAGRVGIVHRIDAHCPAKADQVQTVSLIVGEVIMNAIKHAHPTGIPVEISIYCGRNSSGRTVVEVADDGVGLPENFDPGTQGGAGLRLIRQLASSIHAVLDIESDSLGTRFRIILPHEPATIAS